MIMLLKMFILLSNSRCGSIVWQMRYGSIAICDKIALDYDFIDVVMLVLWNLKKKNNHPLVLNLQPPTITKNILLTVHLRT